MIAAVTFINRKKSVINSHFRINPVCREELLKIKRCNSMLLRVTWFLMTLT